MNLQSIPAEAKRRKIVRIIARLNVGGPAQQACLLHEKLSGYFDTRLVFGSLAAGEHDMSHLLGSESNVFRLPQMSREVAVWSDALAFWRIWRFLRRERPDIVHTHTAKAGAIGRLAAWLAGVPVIVHTYHGHVFDGYFSPLKSKLYLAIERFLGRLTTRVIAISTSQNNDLCAKYRIVPAEKLSVIYNGFELACGVRADREEIRKELGIGGDDFVVVWAGRLAPIKDVGLLAQVIRKAFEKHSRAHFLIVGDGTEKAILESMIKGCPNVQLLGWRQDMAAIWSAADLALLTSRNEGTPTALIEAMAAGRPFVATNVGAVQDLAVAPLLDLPDGVGHKAANGFLTSRTAEALLYCIEQTAKDPEAAKQMASVGRAFVLDTFSADRLVHEMSVLYRTLLPKASEISSAAVQPSEKSASQAGD
jgi:glycosyltransferase involved in cell wall biosynthesis